MDNNINKQSNLITGIIINYFFIFFYYPIEGRKAKSGPVLCSVIFSPSNWTIHTALQVFKKYK